MLVYKKVGTVSEVQWSRAAAALSTPPRYSFLFSRVSSVMLSPCLFLCLLLCYISVFCHFSTFICLSSSLHFHFSASRSQRWWHPPLAPSAAEQTRMPQSALTFFLLLLKKRVPAQKLQKLWSCSLKRRCWLWVRGSSRKHLTSERQQPGQFTCQRSRWFNLLGGKSGRLISCQRESKYENICYSVQKIFNGSSQELVVLKFLEEWRLYLQFKCNPDMNGGATYLANCCSGNFVTPPPTPHPRPWKGWLVIMDKTSRISRVATTMETKKGSSKSCKKAQQARRKAQMKTSSFLTYFWQTFGNSTNFSAHESMKTYLN